MRGEANRRREGGDKWIERKREEDNGDENKN